MPKIDLTNKQYEYFKVLDRNTERTGKNVWWNCQCQCGKIFTATTTEINKGTRKSCGCMKSQLLSQAHLQDLTGQTFGELTVLRRNKEAQVGGHKTTTMYDCLCSCGNVITVERGKLVSRGQSSCGCKQSIGELHIHKILKDNNIVYKSQYTCPELKTDKNGFYKFDFAILNEQNQVVRLIEFDGPQHKELDNFFNDENVMTRDQFKNLFAKSKNIPLVRIPYNKRDCLTLKDLKGNDFLI